MNKNKYFQLINFVEQFRVGTGTNITYNLVSMNEYKGKFYIDDNQYNTFIKLYVDALDNDCSLGFAEKSKEYGPLLIDFDFDKTILHDNQRLYNDDMILLVVEVYRKYIKLYLDVNNDELEVIIFEKPKPTNKNTYYKDGFHLVFNALIINKEIKHIIRHHVNNELINNPMFNGFIKDIEHITPFSLKNGTLNSEKNIIAPFQA